VSTALFRVDDPSGDLVKVGTPRSGKVYGHRCPLAVFEEVAYRLDESEEPTTYQDVHALMRAVDPGVSHTKVAVAFAFLVERGVIRPVHGRKHVGGPGTHLDAMVEYHALREGAPGSEVSRAV
jgi:hypothetical protein